MKLKLNKYSASIVLLVVTLIWGSSYIAVKMALNMNVSAGILNAIRGLIGAILSFLFFFPKIIKMKKKDVIVGVIAGSFTSFGYIIQTVGNLYTTPSNSAFFTVTNVIMIPFIVWIFYKKKPSIKVYLAVAICFIGMAIITGFFSNNITFNIGDFYTLVGAVFFALSIAYFSNGCKDTHFGVIAFFLGLTQMVLGFIYFLVFEGSNIGTVNWKIAILPVLYLGIFSTFLCQALQVVGQQHVPATTSGIILTLEGVFGSMFSVIFGYDLLSWELVIGGVLIVIAILICELNINSFYKLYKIDKKTKKHKQKL